jgi:DNA ligase-1
MQRFAQTAEAIAATRSKLAKISLLADYLRDLSDEDLRAAAVFFTGRPFPMFDTRTLNVGGAALVQAIQDISRGTDHDIHEAYLSRGDLGEVAERLLPPHDRSVMSPAQIFSAFEQLVERSSATLKLTAVTELLKNLTPTEAKYAIKIVTGDLRIGLKENTVEEALAKAFDQPIDAVRRANMSTGDIGETALLARRGALTTISFRLFRPLKFMLATPIETEDEVLANFSDPFYIEDKYDGIRGQLHVELPRAAIYSRTLDEVSHQFPEIIESTGLLRRTLIADGEVVAYKEGQVLPFGLLQKRLGRKLPPENLRREIPVGFMIFDLLYLDGQPLIDAPLSDRKRLLQEIAWPHPLHLAPFALMEDRGPLQPFFNEAERRRNEGLMLKDAASTYAPGKRGMAWLKWKKALATLDVVVTGVEFGHGRRHNVLSDYTFAVRNNDRLRNIGKAYSGLTDQEILELTEFFKAHTLQDFGRFRLVEPMLVLEVAFNGIQKSDRHDSGFALRFPRIVRVRQDKRVEDIDTLETVGKIYASHAGEWKV